MPMRTVFLPGRAGPPKPAVGTRSHNPPLVILIHGLESYSGTWEGVMARISTQAAPAPSVLAVDLRGHGQGCHFGTPLSHLNRNELASSRKCVATPSPQAPAAAAAVAVATRETPHSSRGITDSTHTMKYHYMDKLGATFF